jgi:PIN domain nuclease of toxin-antitoxin system
VALLIDTNVLVWLVENPLAITPKVRDRLRTGEEVVYVSIVSAWEHGQKRKLKPQELPQSFDELMAVVPHEQLDLTFPVHSYAESLPLIHRDPFDRMLIAQAIHHDLELIASDERIHQYPVRWFW